MTTYNVGANTGNTGALVVAHLAKFYPTSNRTAASNYAGSVALNDDVERVAVLVTFPVSGAGTVTNAKLRFANADAMAATATYEARALVNTFVKAEATWNKRNTSTNWNVAGALTGTDVTATVIGTGTSPTAGADTTFDITGALLDAWVQGCIDGSVTVPALIVSKLDDTTSYAASKNRFRSDTGTDTKRPVLIFDFTPATPPTVSVTDVTVSNVSGTASFEVTLSSTYASNVTVDYATADNTATAGVDYTSTSGTLTFTPGQTSKTVVVPILA